MKALVKSLINSVGYDVRRLKGPSNPTFQLVKGLRHFGVDLILDVGANAGQFACELISLGYQGRLVSFEPSAAAHDLLSNTARRHAGWVVHPRVAIGDYDGEVVLNVSRNSVSSSVLPMLDAHLSAATTSDYVSSEKVAIARLDTLVSPYLASAQKPFLKIDTQGFEWKVLDGAVQTLPKMCGVTCELSLIALYEGQHLWTELIDRLEKHGFVLWSIERGFTNQTHGRTLQVDATFFRVSVT